MVLFLYVYARELTTVKFCYQEIGINKNTTVFWCNKIREMMANFVLKKADVSIGGEGKIVEIDESCFTRNKHNKGRKFPLQWVFGGIERGSKKVFLVKVEKRDRDTLMALIKKHIKIGTRIISDEWPAYNQIKDIPGYTHSTVNHSEGYVDKEDKIVHTQTIESTWRLAKHRNKLRCGTHRSMLKGYLCEFMYRRFHRDCDDIFRQIMKDLAEAFPPVDVYEDQEVMEEGSPNDEEEVMEEGSPNDEEEVMEEGKLLSG
jgi:IS1 family transposase